MADLELGLLATKCPQVLAQTSFGCQLAVVREVVIELIGFQLDVDVGNIEFDVESVLCGFN